MNAARRRWCALVASIAISCSGPSPASAPLPTGTTAPATRTAAAVVSTRPSPSSQGSPLIQMAEHFFDPPQLTVTVGTTVTWRNVGVQVHDVHARDHSFDSPTMSPGASFTYTFMKAGTYAYYCSPHEGDGMIGVIEVR